MFTAHANKVIYSLASWKLTNIGTNNMYESIFVNLCKIFSFFVIIFRANTIKDKIQIFNNGSKLKNVNALYSAANNPAYAAKAKYLFVYFKYVAYANPAIDKNVIQYANSLPDPLYVR